MYIIFMLKQPHSWWPFWISNFSQTWSIWHVVIHSNMFTQYKHNRTWWLIEKCVIFRVSISYVYIWPWVTLRGQIKVTIYKNGDFYTKICFKTPGTFSKKNNFWSHCEFGLVFFGQKIGQAAAIKMPISHKPFIWAFSLSLMTYINSCIAFNFVYV